MQHAGHLTVRHGRRVSMADALEDLLALAETEADTTQVTDVQPIASIVQGALTSQLLTEADISSGQIRFPRSAKVAFPAEAGDVDVCLAGAQVKARWNPRIGPDRERSGVLQVGRRHLDGVVKANVKLSITSLIHLE